MTTRFQCNQCDTWNTFAGSATPQWACSSCGTTIPVAEHDGQAPLNGCLLCNNPELYVKKSFPHWLGMSILVVACIFSVITYARHWIFTTWAILIGSAVLDGILYLFMGNATVCYRCKAETRGVPVNPAHGPFDLAVGERYRQERLRRQQLRES